jgi:hypothetical protein
MTNLDPRKLLGIERKSGLRIYHQLDSFVILWMKSGLPEENGSFDIMRQAARKEIGSTHALLISIRLDRHHGSVGHTV